MNENKSEEEQFKEQLSKQTRDILNLLGKKVDNTDKKNT